MSLLRDRLLTIDQRMLQRRDDDAIAAELNRTPPIKVVEYWLTDHGLVSDIFAHPAGSHAMADAILDKLDQMAAASRSVKALVNRLYNDARGLNFGDPALREFFVSNTPAVFSEAERDVVLSLAQRDDLAVVADVSAILNAEGY